MTRCPDCPRTALLKRRVTSTDRNGNLGREFVKCESKPEPGKVRSGFPLSQFCLIYLNFVVSSDLGFRVNIWYYQDLRKCTHFEWLDEYIKRIEMEGALQGLNLPNLPAGMEQLGSASRVATVRNADGIAEVKEAEFGGEGVE